MYVQKSIPTGQNVIQSSFLGVIKNELVVRVVQDKIENELAKDHVRPMDFTGKPLKEFVYVDVQLDQEIEHWIGLGIAHAASKLK